MYTVKPITRAECETYILKIHYARRWPSITWAFGLFMDNELCGVVTYGTPPSSTLRRFIAGDENERYVIELNRLCLKYNRKYEASILVGKSIKLLPKNKLIVSYADTGQNHVGTVYQATNFLYTGLSTKGEVWKVKGKAHLHNITLLDEFRGVPNRTDKLREKYGSDLFKESTTRKHRYVYLHGSRTFKKRIMLALKYKIRDYPKGIDSIKELEKSFEESDNAINVALAETLTSKDFDDIIIPQKHAGEVSRVKRSTSSGEGLVQFQHPDLFPKIDVSQYEVKWVSRNDCEEYLLHIHYAKRWPMISYAFGLFYKKELCGVITYGETTSQPLRVNIAGPAFEHHIIELTRLCLKYNRKNEASFLVGHSIKLLPKNKIIVSFADSGQDHIGCVYQAANFIYTGLSSNNKVLKLQGREDKHEIHLLDEFKGQTNMVAAFKQKYAGQWFYEQASRKHRYIYFYGDRKFKKEARAALKHKARPFPKRTDTIEELDESFSRQDNIDNCSLAEQLSSKDFVGVL